jgi:hypothetical protein
MKPLMLLLIFCSLVEALEHRVYSAASHDRFIGFPATPTHNPNFIYTGSRYTGLGWIKEESGKQVALVSPRHVVFAKHYGLGVGTTIRFLTMSNVIKESIISNVQVVADPDGSDSDVILATLQTPLLAADGISFFSYYNPNSLESYQGQSIVVFGFAAKAGSGTMDSVLIDVDASAAGLGTITVMLFKYLVSSGSNNDAYLVVGDSGSPTFTEVNSQAALVGTHSAVGADVPLTTRFQYDSLIDPLVPNLNALMEPLGYHMKKSLLPSTTLSASIGSSMGVLRELAAGDIIVQIANAATNDANNLTVSLSFASGRAPSSISGAGWICESLSPTTWACRRGGLVKSSSTSLICHWSVLPSTGDLTIDVTHDSDESVSTVQNLSRTVYPSFKAWATPFAITSVSDDADQDGYTNLQEYAFGTNPLVSDSPLNLTRSGNQLIAIYPQRRDADDRGLNYLVKFSNNLTQWTEETPTQTIVSLIEQSPVAPQWIDKKITMPMTDGRMFFRIEVVLDE